MWQLERACRRKGADHVFAALYDFGPCYESTDSVLMSMAGPGADELPAVLQQSIYLTFLGDRGENPGKCYRGAGRDVVLPPYVHAAAFLLPMIVQDIFVFFRGAVQSWEAVRRRVLHNNQRLGGPHATLHGKRIIISAQRVPFGQYVSELSRSTFCLVPPGKVLWSFRFSEVLLAGCIPVIFDQRRQVLPFESLIDWDEIVVRIAPHQAIDVVDTLAKMSKKIIDAKKNAVRVVKDFITYPFGSHWSFSSVTGQPPVVADTFHAMFYQLYESAHQRGLLTRAPTHAPQAPVPPFIRKQHGLPANLHVRSTHHSAAGMMVPSATRFAACFVSVLMVNLATL